MKGHCTYFDKSTKYQPRWFLPVEVHEAFLSYILSVLHTLLAVKHKAVSDLDLIYRRQTWKGIERLVSTYEGGKLMSGQI